MPCSDPDWPWDEGREKSGREAIRILCAQVDEALTKGDGKHLTPELLLWFVAHRQHDLDEAVCFENKLDELNARCAMRLARDALAAKED